MKKSCMVAAIALIAFGAALPAEEHTAYTVTNLVSDQAGVAAFQDLDLVNAWGLAALPTSPWWVSDNGTDRSTLYGANGVKRSLVVAVLSAPTGLVANPNSASFIVTNGTTSASARFIFSTEEGTILGWNPAVAPTTAVVAVPNTTGAIYKGLAIASTTTGDFLYATDFHNARVDVFDSSFHSVTTTGGFADPKIPSGYAPFGIQNVNGSIVVTYAQQDADAKDDVAGQGHGFVDMFDTSGNLIVRVAQHGQLNSPWGIAMAPANFGEFSGDLLIGNFGDGRINAFAPQPDGTFELVGPLRTGDGKRVVIDGLWALQFGHGSPNNGAVTTLFFTAGPEDESHGLFGTIMVK